MYKLIIVALLTSFTLLLAYDPFAILVPKAKILKQQKQLQKKVKKVKIIRKKIVLHLTSILDNYVKINQKWYKNGDKVYNFKIKDIFSDSVVLTTKRGKLKVLNMNNTKYDFIR